jgi:hypothetical protein
VRSGDPRGAKYPSDLLLPPTKEGSQPPADSHIGEDLTGSTDPRGTKPPLHPQLPPTGEKAKRPPDLQIDGRRTLLACQHTRHQQGEGGAADLFQLTGDESFPRTTPAGALSTLSTRHKQRNGIPTSTRRRSERRRQGSAPSPAGSGDRGDRSLFASACYSRGEGRGK